MGSAVNMKNTFKSYIILFIGLCFALLLYYPIFNAEYVWDDTMLFVDNTKLVDGALEWESVSRPILPSTSYLRPLVLASWWAEFQIFGLNTKISHIVGFIFYFLNVILVYVLTLCLARRIVPQRNTIFMATLASLFYLVHPALIESTAWVSGRFDQYVTFFTLLSCVIFVIGSDKERFSILASILLGFTFFAALLSKELGVVLPAILVCLYFVLQHDSKESYVQLIIKALSKYRYACVVLCVVLMCYFALRTTTVAGVYHVKMDWNYIQGIWFNELAPLNAYADYFKQSFLPFYSTAALHPIDEYDFDLISWKLLIILSVACLFYILYQAIMKRSVVAWLSIASVLSIVLVLHLVPLTINDNLIHERFMTQGLAFLAIALVFIPYQDILMRLGFTKRLVKLGLGLLIVVWCSLSVLTVKSIVPMWHSNYTLWYWMHSTYPKNEFARYNYWHGVSVQRDYAKLDTLIEEYYQGKAMDVAEQILYAFSKLQQDDPESLGYYQGVVVALPKLHEPDPALTYERFSNGEGNGVTFSNLSMSYLGLGIAQLRYQGNLEAAKENIDIARYYLLDGELHLWYPHTIAVMYLLGQKEQAMELYQETKKTSRYEINNYQLNSHIQRFCEQYFDKSKQCAEYQQDNPFKENS